MADTSHSLLFLSQREVLEAGVLNMADAVPLMEKVYSLHWRGETVIPSKGVIRWGGVETEWPKGRINALPGWIGGDINTAGIKWIAVSPEGVRAPGMPKVAALVIINDPVTLYPAAIMDGVLVSAIRTGANMGAAALHLAKKNTRSIGIVGAGFQGRTQLMALLVARPTADDIRVYDVNPDTAANYAEHMEARTGRKIRVCPSVDETVKGADIVVTATGSSEPLFLKRHLEPGMLYLHVGGNECEHAVITAADKRYVDDWEQVKHRDVSTLAHMFFAGELKDGDITAELGAVMAGDRPGRESDDEIIYVNTVGLGVQDVALGSMLLASARAKGLGTTLTMWDEPFVL
ncbi:MAG: ornithine cyclodeaminase family protein [Desulfovibrionaceae bacterium]|nr:ornithine cyclodeaminase family protein [Desulfovibrionaceae bacterium]